MDHGFLFRESTLLAIILQFVIRFQNHFNFRWPLLLQDAETQASEGYIDYTNNKYVFANGATIDLDNMVRNRARKPVYRNWTVPELSIMNSRLQLGRNRISPLSQFSGSKLTSNIAEIEEATFIVPSSDFRLKGLWK